jgi:hypothetical protein|tara:strand:+ start:248 stop:532 length:285 start_codon:yes stop_codon:yes gene_type:complete
MRRRYYKKYPYAKQNYEWWGKKKARSERRWTIGLSVFLVIWIGLLLYQGGNFLFKQMDITGFLLFATIGSLVFIAFKAAKPKDRIIKKKRNKRK